jgi:hypothetical protein
MPVLVKKILTWAALIFLILYMAFRPESAAQTFRSIGSALMNIARGLGDFLNSLIS